MHSLYSIVHANQLKYHIKYHQNDLEVYISNSVWLYGGEAIIASPPYCKLYNTHHVGVNDTNYGMSKTTSELAIALSAWLRT